MSGLTVVIPSKTSWNLVSCVSSILGRENPHPRIIVVDDGLQFDSVEPKQFIVSSTQLINGVKPFVFARNCNIGIRMAGDDDVIILNDDALLKTPGGFTAMRLVADAHPEFGIVSASSNNVGNQNMRPRSKYELREDPRMVCFVCVYIPRSTVRQVGELDERFVGYGLDDDDYCLRVRNAGLKIGIYDGCFVDHGTLKSTYRGDGGGDFSANLEIFKQKWGHDNHGVAVS